MTGASSTKRSIIEAADAACRAYVSDVEASTRSAAGWRKAGTDFVHTYAFLAREAPERLRGDVEAHLTHQAAWVRVAAVTALCDTLGTAAACRVIDDPSLRPRVGVRELLAGLVGWKSKPGALRVAQIVLAGGEELEGMPPPVALLDTDLLLRLAELPPLPSAAPSERLLHEWAQDAVLLYGERTATTTDLHGRPGGTVVVVGPGGEVASPLGGRLAPAFDAVDAVDLQGCSAATATEQLMRILGPVHPNDRDPVIDRFLARAARSLPEALVPAAERSICHESLLDGCLAYAKEHGIGFGGTVARLGVVRFIEACERALPGVLLDHPRRGDLIECVTDAIDAGQAMSSSYVRALVLLRAPRLREHAVAVLEHAVRQVEELQEEYDSGGEESVERHPTDGDLLAVQILAATSSPDADRAVANFARATSRVPVPLRSDLHDELAKAVPERTWSELAAAPGALAVDRVRAYEALGARRASRGLANRGLV